MHIETRKMFPLAPPVTYHQIVIKDPETQVVELKEWPFVLPHHIVFLLALAGFALVAMYV